MKINWIFLSLTVLFFLGQFAVPAQLPKMSAEYQELADYIKTNYTKREVMIPMRDGVKLFTSIYEPKDKTQKYPVMFDRTPYSVGPYGTDIFRTLLGPNKFFAKEGYIFVYQDVRGRWMSEGEFIDVRPETAKPGTKETDESTDTYDTIDWLIKNTDNNGRVGMWGISYPGFYTSAGAINSHPALKAISPQAPVSDWFHGDDMHHNGALFFTQNFSFFFDFGQPRPVPTSSGDYLKQPNPELPDDGYNFYLELGGLKNSGDYYKKSIGTRIKFWDEMSEHPNYDKFWEDRNVLPKLKNIKAAVMTVGGWYDNEDLYGALHTYEAIEKQNPGIYNVLVMGPWFHGGWSVDHSEWLGTAYFEENTSLWFRSNLELPFFNHFLKDKGDISNIHEVNAFDTGTHKWEYYDGWNPKNTEEKPLYLQGGGKLSFERQPADKAFIVPDEYVSNPWRPVPYTQKITFNYPRDFMTEDQRFAATRSDVLVYKSEPLTEDLTIAGDIKPMLFVSTSGTDSDFIVKLIDVFPDDYTFPTGVRPPPDSAFSVFKPGGYQMLLRGEPFPARYRNSFEKPEPMKPDEITKISFTMPSINHTFKKGHRIMVQIQSTWFPLVARNPQKFTANPYQATELDFQRATERVYRSMGNPSQIVLTVLKK